MSTIRHEVSAKPAFRRRPGGEGESQLDPPNRIGPEKGDIEQDHELYLASCGLALRRYEAAKEAALGAPSGGKNGQNGQMKPLCAL